MDVKALSIRPFIGTKDYELSRRFYRDLGFKESILSDNMSVFTADHIAFYLQNAYIQDWIDNSMIFMEVEDVHSYWNKLLALDLTTRYKEVKLTPVRQFDWGSECYLHDPSGVLWHIGTFKSSQL